MRLTRIVTAIIAFALMGLIPFTASSASAAPTGAETTTSTTAARAPVTVGARICRSDQAGCPGRGPRLLMYGFVTPKAGPALIQKCTNTPRRDGTCNWKNFNKVNVDKVKGENRGRYVSRVTAPANGKWYWRAKVGGSKSNIWETFRR